MTAVSAASMRKRLGLAEPVTDAGPWVHLDTLPTGRRFTDRLAREGIVVINRRQPGDQLPHAVVVAWDDAPGDPATVRPHDPRFVVLDLGPSVAGPEGDDEYGDDPSAGSDAGDTWPSDEPAPAPAAPDSSDGTGTADTTPERDDSDDSDDADDDQPEADPATQCTRAVRLRWEERPDGTITRETWGPCRNPLPCAEHPEPTSVVGGTPTANAGEPPVEASAGNSAESVPPVADSAAPNAFLEALAALNLVAAKIGPDLLTDQVGAGIPALQSGAIELHTHYCFDLAEQIAQRLYLPDYEHTISTSLRSGDHHVWTGVVAGHRVRVWTISPKPVQP